jgi:hypothetical protein
MSFLFPPTTMTDSFEVYIPYIDSFHFLGLLKGSFDVIEYR